MNKRNRVLRLMAVFAALALVVSACSDDDSGTTEATEAPTTTAAPTTTEAAPATTEAPPVTEAPVEETTTTTEAPAPEITYVAACQPDTEYSTEAYVAPTYGPSGGVTYRTGIFQDTTTDNYWA